MVSCVAALALLMRGFLRTRHRVLVPVVPLVERPPAIEPVVDRFSSLGNPSHGNVSLLQELLPQVWARHRLDNASYFANKNLFIPSESRILLVRPWNAKSVSR